MPLLDRRGRLFGRLNLIDACVLLFVLVIVPIGYVTYRVFRVPTPQILSVTPATLAPGPNRIIRVTGRDLRPYLRAYLNKSGTPFSLAEQKPELSEGRFLVETPTVVEIRLPELAPATYDLYLYDLGQLVAEQLRALTISESGPTTVDSVIRFVVPSDLIPLVHAGDADTFVPVGNPFPGQPQAVLKSAKRIDDKQPATAMHLATEPGVWFGVQQSGDVLEAVVTIPVARGDTGAWQYKKQTIRAGDTLKFETARYAMFGVIQRVDEARVHETSTGGGGTAK